MSWFSSLISSEKYPSLLSALLPEKKSSNKQSSENDNYEAPSSIPLPSLGGQAANIYEQLAEYGPKLAQQEYEAQQKYAPLLAQLGLDIQRDVLPQQLALDLGLAREYQPQFQSLQEQLRSADISAQLGDVSRLAPQLQGIRQAAETPEATAIRKTLADQILAEIQAGESLTDEQLRGVEQGVRSGQQARGLGFGQGSANREAVARSLEGRRLGLQRRAEAQSFLGQESQQQIDPFLAIAGRPATAQATALPFITSPGTQVQSAGQVSSPTQLGSGLLGMAGQQQQQQLANNQLNLAYQLARSNAQTLGLNV